jgi:gamma-glutamylcyclotransferase (GGCT)/AIG2-like uncharacterized protein YtfP
MTQMIANSCLNFYFAYGSNMDQTRMQGRDVRSLNVIGGWIHGYGLRFNKRSAQDANLGCANLVYAPDEQIQGLLYQLQSASEIEKLDVFEGTPYRYSRELLNVHTQNGEQMAWVYIANPSVIDNSLMPATWYLEHLLAGREFISAEYCAKIASTPCVSHSTQSWN